MWFNAILCLLVETRCTASLRYGLLLLLPFTLTAQQLPLERTNDGTDFWTGLRLSSYQPVSGSEWWLRAQGRSTGSERVFNVRDGLPFYQLLAEVGFRQQFNRHWHAGGLLRTTAVNAQNIQRIGAFGGHTGQLGRVWLYKELLVNWLVPSGANSPSYPLLQLRLQAAHRFTLWQQQWRTEGELQLKRLEGDARVENSRRINQAQWQARLWWLPGAEERWWLGLFAGPQTNYLYLLATGGRFAADGTLLEAPKPNRNGNRKLFIFGLQLRRVLNAEQHPERLLW